VGVSTDTHRGRKGRKEARQGGKEGRKVREGSQAMRQGRKERKEARPGGKERRLSNIIDMYIIFMYVNINTSKLLVHVLD